MRKISAIIIIIIIIGVYFYYINSNNSDEMINVEKLSAFEKIISLNAGQDDFYSPGEVVKRNNIILSYLYGSSVQNEEVNELIILQRNLFDPDLLEINPLEIQLEKVKLKIDEYKKSGYKIIEIKQDLVEYEDKNANIAKVKVIQYTNSNTDNYLEYYLRKQEDGTWRIIGWEVVDEFVILNEL